MKPGPNAPCPCGSGAKFKRCCSLILDGQPATTPEALMRSRYTAYALGHVDHILNTTHPDSPHWQADHKGWFDEIDRFCRETSFDRLEVLASRAQGDRGIVAFRAHLSGPGGATVLAERSAFARVDGRWRYLAGSRLDDAPTTPE